MIVSDYDFERCKKLKLLKLPDERQSYDYDCGQAIYRSLCLYFSIRPRLRLASPLDGTSPDILESAFWLSGLSVISGTMDIPDLRYQLRRGRPVACVVRFDQEIGHWVAVCGFHRHWIYFHDPLQGLTRCRQDRFLQSWSDITRRGVLYHRWGIAVFSSQL